MQKSVQWVAKASRVKPHVEYQLPDDLQLDGRKGQVHQIMVNLIQNALDAMEGQADPRIQINCDVSDNQVNLQVIDQGPGIPENDLARVFDPFFTSKPVGQGTGLGLYISYGLAQDMGGDLSAANHASGGAVFALRLPINGKQET